MSESAVHRIHDYNDGSRYEGFWVGRVRHGKGKFTFASKAVYEGNFMNDKRDGYGTLNYEDGSGYKGNWVEDKREG